MNTLKSPESDYLEMEDAPASLPLSPAHEIYLIPSHLWNAQYLLQVPGALNLASRKDPVRVAEVFSQSAPQIQAPNSDQAPSSAFPPTRLTAPSILPYDGDSNSLRTSVSQLVNQIEDHEHFFATEMSKVRFAYQCLGSGALVKMRSCFRCLEDPSVPPEINTLSEFIDALKRQCQDPCLEDKATRAVDTMTQANETFQEFITNFEDNMADSTYASLDKVIWKKMLERRLSYKLRDILISASDIPIEYHSFVAYLRRKDAAIQELKTSFQARKPVQKPFTSSFKKPPSLTPTRPNQPISPAASSTPELTVSQGGSAMDLDAVSNERDIDGRITSRAKDARRMLGRCYRFNEVGHLAINCHLKTKGSGASVSVIDSESLDQESLKD